MPILVTENQIPKPGFDSVTTDISFCHGYQNKVILIVLLANLNGWFTN